MQPIWTTVTIPGKMWEEFRNISEKQKRGENPKQFRSLLSVLKITLVKWLHRILPIKAITQLNNFFIREAADPKVTVTVAPVRLFFFIIYFLNKI